MTTSQLVSDHALTAIGFRLAGTEAESFKPERVDIESTLLDVIDAFTEDYRIAAVLMSWIKVHGNHVIVEKLIKLRDKAIDEAGRSFPWMTLVAAWAVECGYHKWRKLIKKENGPLYLYDPEVSESAILRKGLIPWLEPLGFRVPRDSLRIRDADVLTPKELIQANMQYRNRYIFGASWRADIITAIQNGITIPMEISRGVGCSYEPAYRISREYILATR
jgi:vacuolar-type H+-ATPase subunit F/Vma7